MATGSTGYLPNIDYTARDFETIKAALVTHVQNFFPNDWQDFTESNLGMCILELVAYVGDQLSFYLDRVVNEMFLPTVVQRVNAINLVSLLGYVPRSVSAASAPIQMTLDVAQSGTVTVPIYTTTLDNGGETWEFLENIEIPAGRTDTLGIAIVDEVVGTATTATTYSLSTANQNLTVGTFSIKITMSGPTTYTITAASDGSMVLPYGGSGVINYEDGTITLNFNASYPPLAATSFLATYDWDQNIVAYHGRTKLEQFTSLGTTSQGFTLSTTPVLISPRVEDVEVTPNPNRFEVWVGDPGEPFGNGTGTMWARVDSLVSAGALEEVYALTVDDRDRVTINFGDNINGKVPPAGTLHVIFRTGGGSKGNISIGYLDGSVTGNIGLFSTTVGVTNYETGTGGAERESLNEIRVNAPAYFRTNDTATTEQDFDALALYSQAGLGSVVRAKCRLTPPEYLTTMTQHSSVVLGTTDSTVTEYYFLLPATPMVVDSSPAGTDPEITVTYMVGGVTRTVYEDILALPTGIAKLDGDATCDDTTTRMRYDYQSYNEDFIAGFMGNGVIVDYAGTLNGWPVYPGSVIFHYTIAGVSYVGYDIPNMSGSGYTGTGVLTGTYVVDSTIDYRTGAVVLHFGTHATLTSQNAEPFNLQAIGGAGVHVFLHTHLNGGAGVDIEFEDTDAVNYAAVTADEVVAVLDPAMHPNADVTHDATGHIVITSTTYGSALSSIAIGAPGAGANMNDATNGLNFSTTPVTGVSHAPDGAGLVTPTTITFDYQSCLYLVLNNAPDDGEQVQLSGLSGPNTQYFPTNNIEVYTWAQDSQGNFVAPSDSLKDNLKAYLDLRRVLATSVQVLSGKNIKVNYQFTVEFDPAIDSTETTASIVTAMESYFSDVVNINAGVDVPLAAIYDALYPLSGILNIVAQDVGVRVEVGEGNAAQAVFYDDTDTPGRYISADRLPMVTTAGTIKVYVDDDLAGQTDGTLFGGVGPEYTLVSAGTGPYSVLAGSYISNSVGNFVIKLNPSPARGSKVYVEWLLDEQASADKMALWNIVVDAWEIATLGDIYVNGNKVN